MFLLPFLLFNMVMAFLVRWIRGSTRLRQNVLQCWFEKDMVYVLCATYLQLFTLK